jgi:hypothetical protein
VNSPPTDPRTEERWDCTPTLFRFEKENGARPFIPGVRPHWTIDTFEPLEAVMRWADPWQEPVWVKPRTQDERFATPRVEQDIVKPVL